MNEQFWKDSPKQFCEDSLMAIHSGEAGSMFLMTLRSGMNAPIFALTPEHAKRLSQYMTYMVQEFEKKVRKIEGEDWAPGLKSFLQVQDLKDGIEGKEIDS